MHGSCCLSWIFSTCDESQCLCVCAGVPVLHECGVFLFYYFTCYFLRVCNVHGCCIFCIYFIFSIASLSAFFYNKLHMDIYLISLCICVFDGISIFSNVAYMRIKWSGGRTDRQAEKDKTDRQAERKNEIKNGILVVFIVNMIRLFNFDSSETFL